MTLPGVSCSEQAAHVSGDAVAGDPALDRIDRHLGQIDTEQIGQVAGGDGRHSHRRRRTGDGGSRNSGNGEHVLGDDPPSGSGAAHGGQGHAPLGSNPPGIGRGEPAVTGGDRRRRGGRGGPRRRGWCVNRCGRHRSLGGWSLTLGEQPGDARPAGEHVAGLAELVQRPGPGEPTSVSVLSVSISMIGCSGSTARRRRRATR